eukprot:Blabericola_migrator_1__1201@NODE_1308_length_4843_cov_167_627094_g880_i0_p3_GENE_NODE_1308_length_4843_cov_167_627094_g880_i0NODE_1308_length_4843_cov_167_627094_g880_i0_p3_ORF_typecomplete_len310_score55_83Porin_3/PF01459_22/1_2e18_NODE_1308_length_4843_cov_167_627094_g880_i027673696
MVVFREITAPTDSLLSKGFCHEKPWALEMKHRLTSPSLTESAFLKEDGTVMCNASTSFKVPHNVVINGSLNVDGTAGLGVQIPCCFTGATVSINGNRKVTAKNPPTTTLDLVADLKKAPCHVKAVAQPLLGTWNVSTCATWKLNGADLKGDAELATVGCEVMGTKIDPAALKCSIAASWTKPIAAHKFFGSLKVTPQNKTPFGRFSASVKSTSPSCFGSELGAEFIYNVADERSEMAIGGSWYLDPATKHTQVKAKVDQTGKIAGVLSHKLSDTVNLGLGVQFDATKTIVSSAERPSPYRVGFKLNLLA